MPTLRLDAYATPSLNLKPDSKVRDNFGACGWGQRSHFRYSVLRDRVPDRNLGSARLSVDHLSPERRDQSRVSPTSQRRGGVPCKRLIRDSAGLAALALVNQIGPRTIWGSKPELPRPYRKRIS
jgi:hypothetical protein